MPTTVTQVTGTGFDSNVWGLAPDSDGVTAWAFQDFSGPGIGKWARFSLVNGSIIASGNIFGGLHYLESTSSGGSSVFWAQNNGHYYTLSRPSLGHQTLYKFHIAPSGGGGGEVLDTYSTTTASVDLNSVWGSISFATRVIAWSQGGNDYVAVQSANPTTNVVFNANGSTLVLIGSYQSSAGAASGGQTIFADKFGDLWMNVAVGSNYILTHWHPPDGATGPTLNITNTTLPNTTTGFTVSGEFVFWTHYNASNHSVTLAPYGGGGGFVFPVYTTDMSNVLLGTPGNAGTFTQNAFRADDGSFFLNMIDTNNPYDNTDIEQTITQPSGKFAIQNDTTGGAVNTQVGGRFSVIDPTTLVADPGYPQDITQIILGSAAPAPPQNNYTDHGTVGLHYDAFANMVWSEGNGALAVTYAHTDFSTGSALYLLSFSSPAPTVTSCTPSTGPSTGGTSITDLHGTGFVATPTVTFGGVPATSVVWVSSTQLTCVTPAHAGGAVNIVVTNPDTQSGTLVAGFTYVVSTTTAVVASPNPTTLGATTHLTATVTPASGGSPTGTVQFKENGVNIGSPQTLSGGSATLNWTFTTAGDVGVQTITAVYTADPGWTGSTSPGYSLTINKYPTTISTFVSDENPSQFEDQIELLVIVQSSLGGPTPTGTVTITDAVAGGDFPATVNLDGSGTATFNTNAMAIGVHVLTATYNGDSVQATTSAQMTQTVLTVVVVSGQLPGFALFASYSSSGDNVLTPEVSMSTIPVTGAASTPVLILWTSLNVAKIRITSAEGFDSGVIPTTGQGFYTVSLGFTQTQHLTLAALDILGNPIIVNGSPLVAVAVFTVV